MATYRDPQYMQKYRAANKEQIAAARREYYERNRARLIEEATKRAARNHDAVRLYARVRSCNERYPGKITVADLRLVLERDGRQCYWCEKQNLEGFDLTIEHLKPVNDPDHLTVACRSCNSKRRAGIPHPEKMSYEEQRRRHYERVRKWRLEHAEQDYALNRLYRERHRAELNARARQWKKDHAAQVKAYKQRHREANREQENAAKRDYNARHRVEVRDMKKRWREANKEKVKAQKAASYQRNKAAVQKYREEHREEIAAARKAYKAQHHAEISAYNREYHKRRKPRRKAAVAEA